jgi:hypothetical protein
MASLCDSAVLTASSSESERGWITEVWPEIVPVWPRTVAGAPIATAAHTIIIPPAKRARR